MKPDQKRPQWGVFPAERNAVLRGPKAMRFRFIEENTDTFSAKRMCDVLDVSERGLRAYRCRPASQRQRTDMIVLAHIQRAITS